LIIPFGKNKDETIKVLIDRFYLQEKQFNQLITSLRNDSIFNDKSDPVIHWTLFNDSTKNTLKILGIEQVYTFYWEGRDRQFDLITNWRKGYPIHIYYNSLDSVGPQKGYYQKDSNSNEAWGLGSNWMIWVERKLGEKDQ
jgi:hypothetical protein